ncbi:hypothetical protein G6F59_017926 [Rhizopus arrhizus]|nr:hypothetical protein G6F59_017926 [Rhizopus arrhizus]
MGLVPAAGSRQAAPLPRPARSRRTPAPDPFRPVAPAARPGNPLGYAAAQPAHPPGAADHGGPARAGAGGRSAAPHPHHRARVATAGRRPHGPPAPGD